MLDVQGHCYVGNESYPGSGHQLMVASFHAVRPSTAPRWRCDPEELVLKRHHDVKYPKRDQPPPPSYSRRDTSFSEPLVSHSSHSMTSIDMMHETRLGCKDDLLWRVMRCGFLAGRLAGYCLSSGFLLTFTWLTGVWRVSRHSLLRELADLKRSWRTVFNETQSWLAIDFRGRPLDLRCATFTMSFKHSPQLFCWRTYV